METDWVEKTIGEWAEGAMAGNANKGMIIAYLYNEIQKLKLEMEKLK